MSYCFPWHRVYPMARSSFISSVLHVALFPVSLLLPNHCSSPCVTVSYLIPYCNVIRFANLHCFPHVAHYSQIARTPIPINPIVLFPYLSLCPYLISYSTTNHNHPVFRCLTVHPPPPPPDSNSSVSPVVALS